MSNYGMIYNGIEMECNVFNALMILALLNCKGVFLLRKLELYYFATKNEKLRISDFK